MIVKIDEEQSHQFFSKRKPNSTWSKINKEKIDRLIAEGWMSKAGLDSIERAKQNGSWYILDEVEALIIPNNLDMVFAKHKDSKDYFLSLSKSMKKYCCRGLYWLNARKPGKNELKK